MQFNNIAEIKDFFNEYKTLNNIAKSSLMKYKELQELKSTTGGIRAVNIDGLPKASGRASDPVYNMVKEIEELEKQYIEDVTKKLKRLSEIEDLISFCDEDCQPILSYHYINGMSWENVAETVPCSIRTVHNKHSAALQKILSLHCFAHQKVV